MKFKVRLLTIVSLLLGGETFSQIPVEVFGGHEKATVDILFFKYVKNKKNENSKFLFFNRNRTTLDYRQTSTAYLPTFGFTEAISYNHPKLKGFAPVALVQVFNSGFFPKAGIQYFHGKKEFIFFSWVVSEIKSSPTIDFFILTRFEPKLSEKVNLFTQLELINPFPTNEIDNYSFTQRLRIGVKMREWQFGFGSDFNQFGRASLRNTYNIGVFLRHEFK